MRKIDYQQYRGLSTETKPTNTDRGTEFYEMDTGDTYYSNGDGIWMKSGGTQATLSSIAVTTAPTKTSYTSGELLSYAGMVVTATMSDSTTYALSKYSVSVAEGTPITEDVTVTITFSYKGTTKTTTQAITLAE